MIFRKKGSLVVGNDMEALIETIDKGLKVIEKENKYSCRWTLPNVGMD